MFTIKVTPWRASFLKTCSITNHNRGPELRPMFAYCNCTESDLEPISTLHQQFFHRNSHSMEISFCSHPKCSEVIAMKCCTWHDSCAVVPRAKFRSNMTPCHGVTLKPNFHQIYLNNKEKIVGEMGLKSLISDPSGCWLDSFMMIKWQMWLTFHYCVNHQCNCSPPYPINTKINEQN